MDLLEKYSQDRQLILERQIGEIRSRIYEHLDIEPDIADKDIGGLIDECKIGRAHV